MAEKLVLSACFHEVTFPDDERCGEYRGKTLDVYFISDKVTVGSFTGPALTGYPREFALGAIAADEEIVRT